MRVSGSEFSGETQPTDIYVGVEKEAGRERFF